MATFVRSGQLALALLPVWRFLRNNMPDYEAFYLALENGPHDAIPNSIRGNFIKLTAPNDPLFFLHHTLVCPHFCPIFVLFRSFSCFHCFLHV